MKETDIPTPALVIDVETATRNVKCLAEYAVAHRLKVRPHTKTHKSLRMARLQLEHGAGGLAVAKAGEAKVMAQVCDDILIAYPTLDAHRCGAIGELAMAKSVNIVVAIDSVLAADRLAQAAQARGATVGILVDFDTGMHRTGLQTAGQTVELARHVERVEGLRLDGLMVYQGNITGNKAHVIDALHKVSDCMQQVLDTWKEHGLEAKIVSGGSTPNACLCHHVPQLTEIRPGTYIYYDRNSLALKNCTINDCAARIVATVVSQAVPGKVVLDCGNKTLTSDLLVGSDRSAGFGLIVEYPDAVIDQATEEHGRVDIGKCDNPPTLGERVHVIPNHICPAVNLQNNVWFKDGDGQVEKAPVDARGLLS